MKAKMPTRFGPWQGYWSGPYRVSDSKHRAQVWESTRLGWCAECRKLKISIQREHSVELAKSRLNAALRAAGMLLD